MQAYEVLYLSKSGYITGLSKLIECTLAGAFLILKKKL